jgi:hypothetical protein
MRAVPSSPLARAISHQGHFDPTKPTGLLPGRYINGPGSLGARRPGPGANANMERPRASAPFKGRGDEHAQTRSPRPNALRRRRSDYGRGTPSAVARGRGFFDITEREPIQTITSLDTRGHLDPAHPTWLAARPLSVCPGRSVHGGLGRPGAGAHGERPSGVSAPRGVPRSATSPRPSTRSLEKPAGRVPQRSAIALGFLSARWDGDHRLCAQTHWRQGWFGDGEAHD